MNRCLVSRLPEDRFIGTNDDRRLNLAIAAVHGNADMQRGDRGKAFVGLGARADAAGQRVGHPASSQDGQETKGTASG